MVKIDRPVLKPFDKDRFELVSEYQICFYESSDREIFLDLDEADERAQGSVCDIRNRSTKRSLTKYKLKSITIPKGYKTNGANIPRIFWSIFPPNSPEYLSAALVHDYLCDEAEDNIETLSLPLGEEYYYKNPNGITFKFADEILREMMTALGCGRFKTALFYYACRAWHKIRYGE